MGVVMMGFVTGCRCGGGGGGGYGGCVVTVVLFGLCFFCYELCGWLWVRLCWVLWGFFFRW